MVVWSFRPLGPHVKRCSCSVRARHVVCYNSQIPRTPTPPTNTPTNQHTHLKRLVHVVLDDDGDAAELDGLHHADAPPVAVPAGGGGYRTVAKIP